MENTTETTASSGLITPRAGLLRGVRLWGDPDGILESPFEEYGQQMGYVFVYGEEAPSVFDGTKWVSIVAEGKTIQPTDISNQYYKILEHAKVNPVYQDISKHIAMAGVA
jgi:hypothetical protein